MNYEQWMKLYSSHKKRKIEEDDRIDNRGSDRNTAFQDFSSLENYPDILTSTSVFPKLKKALHNFMEFSYRIFRSKSNPENTCIVSNTRRLSIDSKCGISCISLETNLGDSRTESIELRASSGKMGICSLCSYANKITALSCIRCRRALSRPNSSLNSSLDSSSLQSRGAALEFSRIRFRNNTKDKPYCITLPEDDDSENQRRRIKKSRVENVEGTDNSMEIKADELINLEAEESKFEEHKDSDERFALQAIDSKKEEKKEIKEVDCDTMDDIKVIDETSFKIDELFGDRTEIHLNLCRVYFGTFGCAAEGLKLTKMGFKFLRVPVWRPGNEENITRYNITIPASEISQVFGNIEGERCVLMILMIAEACQKISEALKLTNDHFKYCTQSSDELNRMIVVEFLEPQEDVKECIRLVLENCDEGENLKEINEEDAYLFLYNVSKKNDEIRRIFEEESCKANQDVMKRTRSTKPNRLFGKIDPPSVIDLDDTHCTCTDISSDFILSYPPNEKDAVAIYQTDLSCLSEGEFLNDTILGFYLKYIQKELINPEIAERTYIFSTFFYGRLTNNQRNDSSKPAGEKYYDRVKNWTKNLDIFEKDFLIIPMNKNYHWFLAIICNPCDVPDENEMQTVIVLNSQASKDPTKRPCILFMDSLGSSFNKFRLVDPLRHFLRKEWETKKGSKKIFSKQVMPDYYMSVPCQTNTSDCGLFVLQYVESFLQDPNFVLRRTNSRLKEWFPLSSITNKRKEIKALIKSLRKECPSKNYEPLASNQAFSNQDNGNVFGGTIVDEAIEMDEEMKDPTPPYALASLDSKSSCSKPLSIENFSKPSEEESIEIDE